LFVEALCTTVALSALHLLNVPIVTHEYAASHIVNVLAADESKWVRLSILVSRREHWGWCVIFFLASSIQFSSCCLQLRAALLEEIRLAATTLLESSKFTVGVATAISAHINASLVSSASVSGSKQLARQVMYLEHARLLDVQPLRALLHFLWTQLGFRWMFLPLNQKTEDLTMVSVCPVSPASLLPVHL